MMIKANKYKKNQGRLIIFLGFIVLIVLFKLPVFANNIDDWASPLNNAQILLAKQKYKDALVVFKKQADLDNGLAQFNVALFYDLGWGIPLNRATACQWYQKAAKNNMPGAMQALGQCFLEGQGVEQNKKLAYHWFIKAFEQGIAEGAFQAGELLLSGDGIEINLIAGQRLCLEAAQQGSISAQKKLAQWYFDGQYFPQDYQQAFNWLQRVASEKSPSSAYLLAQFYDQGIGMDVDESQALRWYEIAASGKYQKAYLSTALLYWQQFTQAKANKEQLLAKSYLWAKISSTSLTSIQDKNVADQILAQVLQQMPETWFESLDRKIVNHLVIPQ
ncbi:sel1 repeat family protein [Colwellia sp. Arc7-635]|uniref:tetratricopeptide repeat protein n=1 Tax=Colwellia sp. Arc7-635 TaxID=2497879 RepID=UPI000F856691|nr:tetratricopeptide repeat protein [Colwellia sp. Arc7-635]AZQ84858.1 sel1 repeat family protein [Colwellia sp. Arc7-635]